MRNLFLSSARPRFVNKDEVLELARTTASRIGSKHPNVVKILLFGSFARNDFGVHSDLDLLIILGSSQKTVTDRIADFLEDALEYPTDVFPYTEQEIHARLRAGDPFLIRASREGIQLYPALE